MAENTTDAMVRGRASYCKMLPQQSHPNYNRDGFEWTLDVYELRKQDLETLKALGVGDRIKQKDSYLDGEPYFKFKQKCERADGKKNDPVPVVDAEGRPWNPDNLIGNGSLLDVKFVVMDFGRGKPMGVYPRSIRVLDWVPYMANAFEELPEADKQLVGNQPAPYTPPARSEPPELPRAARYDLDDDIPF